MNIVVKTASGRCIVRPDTTWEKDNENFFPPEFVNSLSWSPVLTARISKPGRSVGDKFAGRYYDEINYGVLLYPDDMLDGSDEGYAQACCLDHTSFLPSPGFPKDMLGKGEEFRLFLDKSGTEEMIFSHSGADDLTIRTAIAEMTRFVYIRTGDLLAIELQPRRPLCLRSDGEVCLSGTFGWTEIIDFRIIF